MKILHLEDDATPNAAYIRHWIEEQEDAEVKFIGNAYNSGKEIAAVINWCDVLAFTSTFHYMANIRELLNKVLIPIRKSPLTIIINGYEVKENVKRLVESAATEWITIRYDKKSGEPIGDYVLNEEKADGIAYSMRNLILLEYIGYGMELRPITVLEERIRREKGRLKFEAEYKADAPNRVTGRKVKIGDLRSVVGKEWSRLEVGKIVDELDMSLLDPRPGWGVWVMGLTEPVKLIGTRDAHEYREYEIIQ